MEYSKLTVKKLRSLINERLLKIPSSGSGKNGNVIRIDLIDTLKYDDLLPVKTPTLVKTPTPVKTPNPVKTPTSVKTNTLVKTHTKTDEVELSIDEFDKLPKYIMVKVAYNLTPRTTIKYCSLSKNFVSICNKESFWIKKYKKDFDDYDEIRPSIRDVYTFNANLNADLVNLLTEYADFDEYNYEYKKKLYNNALETFKKIEKDMEEYNKRGYENDAYLWEYFDFKNIKKILGKRAVKVLYGPGSYAREIFNDDSDLINLLMDVYNSVMGTEYKFEED